MPSIDKQFVEDLTAKGANSRDIAYASANIPKDFWNINRSGISVSEKNQKLFQYICNYVDNLHTNIAAGKGLTLIGPPKSGKTMYGCAIVKSAAINPETGKRDYTVVRVNYDTIIDEFHVYRNEQETYIELRNYLIKADLLFLDSISPTPPPGVLLSIFRTRQDYQKATILAACCSSQSEFTSMKAKIITDMFTDINNIYMVVKL